MNILGLILARGGSKRVPGKNLRLLDGVPLICWTIVAGQMARTLDHLVVSSEDEEILEVARDWGAETLVRPAEMATDEASPYPAMLHAMNAMEHGYEYLCLLQPTSPFRTHMDIDSCVMGALLHDLACVVAVEEGQSVPNGSIYVARTDWLRDRLAMGDPAPFDGPIPCKYDMAPARSLDIDTEEDFALAEAWVA